MDLIDILLQVGLITATVVCYLVLFRKPAKNTGPYRTKGWNYPLKLLCARYAVRRRSRRPSPTPDDLPWSKQADDGWDSLTFRLTAADGSTVVIGSRRLCGRQVVSEITVIVQLPDGTVYTLPRHPETAVCYTAECAWSAGPLTVEVTPEGQTRVLFNGTLRRRRDGELRHVRIDLLWTTASEAHRHPRDWSPAAAAAALALEPWRGARWPELLDRWEEGGVCHWGAAQGSVEDLTAPAAPAAGPWLRLRGCRERRWAPHGYAAWRRSLVLMMAAEDGTMVMLQGMSYKDVLTEVWSGCVRYPDSTVAAVSGADLALADIAEHPTATPDVFTVTVSTSRGSLKLAVRARAVARAVSGAGGAAGPRHARRAHAAAGSVDGRPASGLLELGYATTEPFDPAPLAPAPALVWRAAGEAGAAGAAGYCVPLAAPAAACPALVGGKAASLALLASVEDDEDYTVPPAFCVSAAALRRQLAARPALAAAVADVEAANVDYCEHVFRAKCDRAAALIAATELVPEVQAEIETHVAALSERCRARRWCEGDTLRFAVRSSAVGEDGAALSAAGQNASVLGAAAAAVPAGVRACWASMYAFNSAQYRRQNGQPCSVGGGVVVQALAPARAAGVMFTAHPAHGDPARLLIAANWGLGESVVSGTAEPDTIIVSRSPTGLAVQSITLGSKLSRVAADGVTTTEVPEEQRSVACVDEALALRLAAIGVRQEVLWGAPRDIEWAVHEDTVYLVQARPVTSLRRWSRALLLHEPDTPVLADSALLTTANTGEVMPRPLSPLGRCLVLAPLSAAMGEAVPGRAAPHAPVVAVTHHRAVIDSFNSLYRYPPPAPDVALRSTELAVHGRAVADDAVLAAARRAHPPPPLMRARAVGNMLWTLFTAKSYMNSAIELVSRFDIEREVDTAPDLAAALERVAAARATVRAVSRCHAATSSASTAAQIVAMTVLLEGAAEVSAAQCADVGRLLGGSGAAVSAGVPRGLARLARALHAAGAAAAFRAQPPETALQWLEENAPGVHAQVMAFLEEHGHRGYMEFDVATVPWALAPAQLMAVLQATPPAPDAPDAGTVPDGDVVAALATPTRAVTRTILRWLLPLCRRGVARREETKSQLILAVHRLRRAARAAAARAVRAWLLPDPDLVFYFTLDELREYARSRDVELLRKAVQRRAAFPSWAELRFPELNFGWPEPLAPVPVRLAAAASLRATPVCAGDVVARACVIKDLSEISALRAGDILITPSTDIGWSAYFPLLAGIATELGGLISHGAVIARECGLPCVVGCAGATELFRTGDLVRLSGAAGLLEKVARDDGDHAAAP